MQKKNKWLDFATKEWPDLSFLLLLLLTFIAYGLMNRDWGNAHDLSIVWDYRLPLFPPAIFVYHLWAPSIFFVLILLFSENRKAYRSTLISLACAGALAFTTFFIFTTQVARPALEPANSLAERILVLTYAIDAPFAGFPSYHVLSSCIILYFYLKYGKTLSLKISLSLLIFLICVSTLLTKQHVLADLLGGIIFTYPSVIIGVSVEKRLSDRKAAEALGT